VIREDRELLTELARVNRGIMTFAMRVMEGSAEVEEQCMFGARLIAIGEAVQKRAQRGAEGIELVIEGETVEAIDTTAHRTKL